MKILLTARIDGARFEDEETGEIIRAYEGYEILIEDAESLMIEEESGELVANVFYPTPENEVLQPFTMYSLDEWNVYVRD